MDMHLHQRLVGLGETVMGGTLMTTAYWSPLLEHVVAGAHVVAALGGAIVGVHGVWRIIRRGRRAP